MRGSRSEYLADRQASGHPIRAGLVGVGQMGAGIVGQSAYVNGIDIAALADRDQARAARALERIGLGDPLITDDERQASDALVDGRAVVTREPELLVRLPVDVVIEATGKPEAGARVGIAAALAKKHLVTMNVESDVTIGRLLTRLFELSGAVYTVGAGDEPSVAWELVDLCRATGLEVVAAGKGKNNPLVPTATQDSVRSEALSKRMNPRMLASFVDGTKTMCEMAALANASGLGIDVPGMHGAKADEADLVSLFRPTDEGGLLSRRGVVDYVQGDVAPGVFVVVHTDDADAAANLEYLKVGPGPYWSLTRPFHLTNIELPISIVDAVRDGRPTLVPQHYQAEVGASTKRALAPGERIEGIGCDEVYGYTWPAEVAQQRNLVPLGLTEGATVTKHVAENSALTFDDVELDEASVVVRAWRLQQNLEELGGAPPWRSLLETS